MARVFDLEGIRKGLARLDEIAREHPELVDSTRSSETGADAWERTLAEQEAQDMADPIFQFRLDRVLVERLDRYADWLGAQNPAFRVSRSAALRQAVIYALDAWEKGQGIAPDAPAAAAPKPKRSRKKKE
ncbi:MAG: hypothetical protein HYV07_26275 [Deltaproteobacteria bacterium]|nr:hypothetical protein [Deltaproteobacteria bacterium]